MVNVTQGANDITVSRENLLSDAIGEFAKLQNMKKVLRVTFQNEVSKDVGGISREFFTTLMTEMFHEAFGLFQTASTEQFSYKVADDSREIVGHE